MYLCVIERETEDMNFYCKKILYCLYIVLVLRLVHVCVVILPRLPVASDLLVGSAMHPMILFHV